MREKLLRALQNPILAKKLAVCATRWEAEAVLREEGLAYSLEEVVAAMQQGKPHDDGELSEDELDSVAGGLTINPGKPLAGGRDIIASIQGAQEPGSSAREQIGKGPLASGTDFLAGHLMDLI